MVIDHCRQAAYVNTLLKIIAGGLRLSEIRFRDIWEPGITFPHLLNNKTLLITHTNLDSKLSGWGQSKDLCKNNTTFCKIFENSINKTLLNTLIKLTKDIDSTKDKGESQSLVLTYLPINKHAYHWSSSTALFRSSFSQFLTKRKSKWKLRKI